MGNLRPMYTIVLGLIFLMGCIGNSSLVKFVKEGGLETKGLINLALASSGEGWSCLRITPIIPHPR